MTATGTLFFKPVATQYCARCLFSPTLGVGPGAVVKAACLESAGSNLTLAFQVTKYRFGRNMV